MPLPSPNVVIIAGANGSGKSTAAPDLLRDYLGVMDFVNADTIAQGLSGFGPDSVAFEAGGIMLRRLRQLAARRMSFAFETTLASRSLAPWMTQLRQDDYRAHLLFLWLPSPEIALARVATRVQQGGHDVPASTVRRRYHAGLRNFFRLYRPIVNAWTMFDNSHSGGYELIASQSEDNPVVILNRPVWDSIEEGYR